MTTMARAARVATLVGAFLYGTGLAAAQFVDRPGATRLQFESKDFGYVFLDLVWPKERDGRTVVFVCWSM